MSTPQGPWMLTASGRRFWPADPRADDVCLYDVAWALSHACRFAGHTKHFYSVAQHSVLVAELAPADLAYAALLHDAAEAYIGDLVRPAKTQCPDYKRLEEGIDRAVRSAFSVRGLATHDLELIGGADLRALMTERRDLMNNPRGWPWIGFEQVEPREERIAPLAPRSAFRQFLEAFEQLTPSPDLADHADALLRDLSHPRPGEVHEE